MRMPRLLPLVAVAAGGVLAINAIENGPGIVGAARSFAEGVAPKTSSSAAAASALPPRRQRRTGHAAVVAAKPAPVCAESPTQLAKEAGLSPAELQVIQSLGARRGELDQREQGLSTELALIQAAEAKVDARIATMNGLKADMQALLGQLDDKQQARGRPAGEGLRGHDQRKPQDAADRFVLLSDDVRLPIAAKMKERLLSAMIAKMPPPEAKRLTESLAGALRRPGHRRPRGDEPAADPGRGRRIGGGKAGRRQDRQGRPRPASARRCRAGAAEGQARRPSPAKGRQTHRQDRGRRQVAREDRSRHQAAGAGLAAQAGGWRPGAGSESRGDERSDRGQDGRRCAGDQAGGARRRAARQVGQLGAVPRARRGAAGQARLASLASGPAPARRCRRDRGAGDRRGAGSGRGARPRRPPGPADDPRRPGRGLLAHRVPLGGRRARWASSAPARC